jgi:hypothetical protein
MRKVILFLSILVSTHAYTQGGSLVKKGGGFTLFKKGNLALDLKFIDPEKGSFGIDYKAGLERKLSTFGRDSFQNINLKLNSRGFITVVGEENNNNSLISELGFNAFPLFFIKRKATEGGDWRDAIMNDTTEIDDPENDPLIIEARQLAQQVESPLWIFFDVQAKHETTQDFKKYDFALGARMSVSTSFLNAILDFPFGLLRFGKNNNPRQLDLSVGYDYVLNVNKTDLKNLVNKESLNRLHFRGEWETGIFTGKDRLVFYFDGHKHMNATQAMKAANKDWNTFYMVKLEHVLHGDPKKKTLMKISIKYTGGALPPNFNQGFVLGGGFSLDFQ